MTKIRKCVLFTLLACILPAILCSVPSTSVNPSLLTPKISIGKCHACKLFVESFKNGLERTTRGNYEGGDTAWEEEKLQKSYKRSEMRLVDIQDGICKDVEHSDQCFIIAEEAENDIEEWWTQNLDESDNIFPNICIDKLKLCCPPLHYGQYCKPCLGDHNNICSGNGKCRGDGTRKGNGTCACDDGYTGKNCNKCIANFYFSENDNKITCSPCHIACSGGCRDGSQKDCVACKPGFLFDQDDGCIDINECEYMDKCKKDQFCLNSLGSFKCVACDKSCSTCYSDGPDSCRKCAKGYSKKGEFCIQSKEEEDPFKKLTTTRYITYFGLIIAVLILISTSTHWGGFIGVTVIWYILCAEYYWMINEFSSSLNLKDFIATQLFS